MKFGWINGFGGLVVIIMLIPNIIYAVKNQGKENNCKRGVRMSKKRYEIVSYDIPLWLKPVLSVTETSIYTGISANKIYEMSESEDCPFVIWIGSRRVIKRKSFEEYLERQYSI